MSVSGGGGGGGVSGSKRRTRGIDGKEIVVLRSY